MAKAIFPRIRGIPNNSAAKAGSRVVRVVAVAGAMAEADREDEAVVVVAEVAAIVVGPAVEARADTTIHETTALN